MPPGAGSEPAPSSAQHSHPKTTPATQPPFAPFPQLCHHQDHNFKSGHPRRNDRRATNEGAALARALRLRVPFFETSASQDGVRRGGGVRGDRALGVVPAAAAREHRRCGHRHRDCLRENHAEKKTVVAVGAAESDGEPRGGEKTRAVLRKLGGGGGGKRRRRRE